MDKVYILHESFGEYEDRVSFVHSVYTTFNLAEKVKKELERSDVNCIEQSKICYDCQYYYDQKIPENCFNCKDDSWIDKDGEINYYCVNDSSTYINKCYRIEEKELIYDET